MTIDTRTYGNVTRSFNRADWTEADINFYVQHILPEEVEAEQQSWDEAHDSLIVHESSTDYITVGDFIRLNPRPELAEDHPLPDESSYGLSCYEEATKTYVCD